MGTYEMFTVTQSFSTHAAVAFNAGMQAIFVERAGSVKLLTRVNWQMLSDNVLYPINRRIVLSMERNMKPYHIYHNYQMMTYASKSNISSAANGLPVLSFLM